MRSGFSRVLFGYRRGEVDLALAERDAELAQREGRLAAVVAELEVARRRIAELELVAERLSACAAQREAELGRARAELDRAREEAMGPMRRLLGLAQEIENIRSQARGQATRIRMLALRETAARWKESESGETTDAEEEPGPPSLGTELADAEERIAAAGAVSTAPERAVAAPRIADDIFVGTVEVEVGPLSDFSQLVGLEDAAAAIDATAEISVTRFAQGRATLALKLTEPVELLRELEERAPFEFKVRDTRADRLVLDVDEE